MDISSLRERKKNDPFSVGELNNYIKSVLECDRTLSAVSVSGEISNFVHHGSGHIYFSLKDETSQVKAVMFRSSAVRLKFKPENGMRVTVHGSVSVYSQGGVYQLYVNSMSPDGVGALYLAYEQTKERLMKEGLFCEEHKKSIPKFPRRVGVITSPTGAAVRDIINVTGRRFPLAEVFLYPSQVQGDTAEEQLIKALDYFDTSGLVDVIIIGRGGGSIEDLWAFNGERLARRIYSHSVPIISAVGHETDFTICDFVADLRAPTPSAAAELAVPDVKELLLYIDNLASRVSSALKKRAEHSRAELKALTSSGIFADFKALTKEPRRSVDALSDSLVSSITAFVKERRTQLALSLKKLEALSPLSVLSRGFSVAECGGRTIKSISDVSLGDEISVRLTDGMLGATVIKKETFNGSKK